MDSLTSNSALSAWMANCEFTRLESIPLCNIYIPGSHDSGAYELYPKLGFSVDRPDLANNWLLNVFSFISYPLVQRFSITQRLTVYEQLKNGVRYLDLRIALRPEDNQFYICHNFYGPNLKEILYQIKTFLTQFSKEVIVIDIQHVHGFGSSEDSYCRLFDMIFEYFNGLFIPCTGPQTAISLTLRSIWNIGKQVILVFRHPMMQLLETNYPFLWNGDQLPNPWANTRDPKSLYTFLCNVISKRPPGKLFVTQGVLTPNGPFVIRNLFGTLEKTLCWKANETLLYLLSSISTEIPHQSDDDQTESDRSMIKTFGGNIIMFDFVDWKQCKLAHCVVDCNSK